MLNAEKFKDEILEVAKVNSNIAFNLEEERVTKCSNTDCADCLFKEYKGKCDKARYEWLLSNYEEPILDEAEREYLSRVCEPYKVKSIEKCGEPHSLNRECEFIVISIQLTFYCGVETVYLPDFIANTMYRGMKVGKKYTPKELGIKCKNNPTGEIKHD